MQTEDAAHGRFGDDVGTHTVAVTIEVDGETHTVDADTRTTLLDLCRETIGNTAAKKGCDHGQCGACTVLLNGRRSLSCLTLVAQHDGSSVVTAAGLNDGDDLHPVPQAFVDHDGFQCGYCTPGQICSAVGMLDEHRAGWPSHVTDDVTQAAGLSDPEIRERMSGNLCRCGAYPHIVAAIREVAS